MVATLAVVSLGLAVAAMQNKPEPVAQSESLWSPASPPPVTRETVRAYVLGDSLTLGAGAGDQAASFAAGMCRKFNWVCTLDGIGGAGYTAKGNAWKKDPTVDESFPTRLEAIVSEDPDIVVLAGGRNDMYSDQADVEAAAGPFLQELRAKLPAARIVVIAGFLWDTDSEQKHGDRQAEVTAGLRAASADQNVTFIDPRGLVNINQDNISVMVSADGFHPTAAGYREISSALVALLRDAGFPLGPELWRKSESDTWEDRTSIAVEASEVGG